MAEPYEPTAVDGGRDAFPSLESPPAAALAQLSPAALAYLGDAVYELYIRRRYLLPPQRLAAYHAQVVACVRAEQQAAQLQSLAQHLTAAEQQWVRRGRNAAGRAPARLAAGIYQQASGFETLIGYLYLAAPQRLNELLACLDFGELTL
ncbi:MAG: Mini-ribonuclease 3 [Spirulinaceae cyanobacterium RM2_2_10]|nr:Mini-ribonuclease 3 [Spirulinaceae cyanobacterium SM2_1_0]NJO19625.1 Mini-ribonuclease 3 [Spirulinaceae cyanobacterium RM2_2_10]